jgi:hypothetical protein
MRTKIALMTSLAALGALIPATALAQDAAAPPTAAPAAATPAAETPSAASAPTGTAPAEAPPAAAPAGPTPLPGWMRIDSDFGGLQLWGGATFPLADGIGLAFDMYVLQLGTPLGGVSLGEFDIGPAITAGPFTLTPMLGVQMDYTNRRAQALVPQFYVTGGPSPIYSELWFQYYNNKVFNKDLSNQINGRLIVDYKISDYVGVGPELDLGFDSKGLPNADGDAKKVYSLPVGVNLLFTNVGLNSTFMGFLGYETGDPSAQKNHLGGRLTFVHNF